MAKRIFRKISLANQDNRPVKDDIAYKVQEQLSDQNIDNDITYEKMNNLQLSRSKNTSRSNLERSRDYNGYSAINNQQDLLDLVPDQHFSVIANLKKTNQNHVDNNGKNRYRSVVGKLNNRFEVSEPPNTGILPEIGQQSYVKKISARDYNDIKRLELKEYATSSIIPIKRLSSETDYNDIKKQHESLRSSILLQKNVYSTNSIIRVKRKMSSVSPINKNNLYNQSIRDNRQQYLERIENEKK